MGRAMFPKIIKSLNAMLKADEALQTSDEKYLRNVGWLAQYSEQKIGIERQFCHTKVSSKDQAALVGADPSEDEASGDLTVPPNLNPMPSTETDAEIAKNKARAYGGPISYFSMVAHSDLPDERMASLLRGVQAIEVAATMYAKERGEATMMSADQLFPIIVYCTIHSGIRAIFTLIRCLELFLPDDVATRGQTGFVLSLFKAAAQYIVSRTEDSKDFASPSRSPSAEPETVAESGETQDVDFKLDLPSVSTSQAGGNVAGNEV